MKHSSLALPLMMAVLVALLSTAPAAHATDCVVMNTSDSALGAPPVPDSLRDCMERSRHGDTITFDSTVFALDNSDAATVINIIDSALNFLDDGITLDASDRRVTINGSAAGSSNGLTISSSGNVVRGLTIVGFSGSGIQITGGSSNVIGGDPSIGGGPNGQGLRISANGAFGVEISGPNATGNVIKGCWIGLDAGGIDAEPNLGGVSMNGGAASNTIGSVVPGEENVISGNTGAGITISGPGTDSNALIGNIVGASATTTTTSRRELPNGGPGVSIVDGAQLTQVGGTNPGEGNVIANNGGSGVEVRATNSKLNSARGNAIAKNKRGGITLFDGSNGGVSPPKIQKIVQAPPSGTGPQLAVSVRTTAGGTVEIFNDSGDQGETFLGRINSATYGNLSLTLGGNIIGGDLNVTSTFTDDNGNTSPFGVFLPGLDDTDSDGWSDELEAQAGTDPNDRLAQPLLAGVLRASKVAVKLNFAKSSSDAIDFKATLVLPPGYLLPGASYGVMVAGHGDELVLDPKGKAKSPDGLVSMAVKTSSKTGVTTVQYKVKKSALQAEVGPFGLDDRTTDKAGEAVVVPFAVTTRSAIGGSVYNGLAAVTYKATQGKSGKAKQ